MYIYMYMYIYMCKYICVNIFICIYIYILKGNQHSQATMWIGNQNGPPHLTSGHYTTTPGKMRAPLTAQTYSINEPFLARCRCPQIYIYIYVYIYIYIYVFFPRDGRQVPTGFWVKPLHLTFLCYIINTCEIFAAEISALLRRGHSNQSGVWRPCPWLFFHELNRNGGWSPGFTSSQYRGPPYRSGNFECSAH